MEHSRAGSLCQGLALESSDHMIIYPAISESLGCYMAVESSGHITIYLHLVKFGYCIGYLMTVDPAFREIWIGDWVAYVFFQHVAKYKHTSTRFKEVIVFVCLVDSLWKNISTIVTRRGSRVYQELNGLVCVQLQINDTASPFPTNLSSMSIFIVGWLSVHTVRSDCAFCWKTAALSMPCRHKADTDVRGSLQQPIALTEAFKWLQLSRHQGCYYAECLSYQSCRLSSYISPSSELAAFSHADILQRIRSLEPLAPTPPSMNPRWPPPAYGLSLLQAAPRVSAIWQSADCRRHWLR